MEKRTYFILENLSVRNRRALAKEIKDTAVLDELADDLDDSVRYEVAGNFCSAISTLKKLQEDDNRVVSRMAKRTLDVLLCG